ncbi:hypothetical protein [Nocardioides sp. 616]|uniref:SCO4402 family protein n=1 Tax=Nocardioides sp. 616 TaxID=2268090 RepID=UPI0013B436F8|nr:hypothetical protein [Nocardioides sp. 616]
MSGMVTFPDMRLEVISALRSLSDRHHQQTRWGKVEEGVNFYDDLTLNVHTLYDDCMVLPEPQAAVPDVIHDSEVPVFLELGSVLGPMLQDLGDAPDGAYMSDPRWASVVDAAGAALAAMQQADEGPAP